jgi:prolyl oligopeptidase
VAVSLSEGGSEVGTLHIYETAGGKELPDVIPRVQCPTGGGSVAWDRDGTGFYYTRYPRGREWPPQDLDFYQQVYFHKLGTPAEKDTYALGKDFPRIAETLLQSSDDGRYILASVANGDGGEFAHYLRGSGGKWVRVAAFADGVAAAAFGPRGGLYLFSRKGAPRGQILRVPLARPELAKAEIIVRQSDVAIEGVAYRTHAGYVPNFVPTPNRLYVIDQAGGPSQVRVFDHRGRQLGTVPTRRISSVGQALRLRGDELLFRNETFIDPPAWYRFDPATGKATRTALFRSSPADFRDSEVVREFTVSRDGTRVPLNIIRRRGTRLDGRNPTILYGYGGFGISESPRFGVNSRVNLRVWLEQGGVFAVANLRGGSEFGEEWHRAGSRTRKQNAFDDFAACARHLIARKYTGPERLAILGGSNGGLLMGAALTQHPGLFRAVVSHVGLYDMLRFERLPNGAFNAAEYGSVKDPEQFRALHAYSPYHRVKDGVRYPAVLLLAGANDGRVAASHSWKMAARLQAATASGRPVLLWTSFGAGHGLDSGLSEHVAVQTDVLTFLFRQLGMTYRAARRGAAWPQAAPPYDDGARSRASASWASGASGCDSNVSTWR